MKNYILITGGSGGIGSEILKHLYRDGFNIINIDKKKKNHKISEFIKCDLSNQKSIIRIFKKLKNKNINALINCAGVTLPGNTIRYSYKNWEKTFNINLNSAFICSQEVAKVMIKKKILGSIINISSISGHVVMPNSTAYNVSKAALIHLTKSLALDFSDYSIKVNSISPGYTKTNMTKKSWGNKKLRNIRTNKTILKRWAEPNSYNEAISFLLKNPKSSYITGTDIIIDGGWTIKGL